MRHDEFRIDETFWCGGQSWRCTDIGARTIVAICLDRVDVDSPSPELVRTLNRAEAEAEGWFNGPPYAVAEHVFGEDGIVDCSTSPAGDTRTEADLPEARSCGSAPHGGVELAEPNDDAAGGSSGNLTPNRAYATTLREQARLGGLRFESYLPSELAEWLLAKIESGVFADPSEAVFVMLGEQHDLEPHTDLRHELERRCLQASLDDPRPRIPHEEVKTLLKRLIAACATDSAYDRCGAGVGAVDTQLKSLV